MEDGGDTVRVPSRGVLRPRSLDPAEVISTRTRGRTAAAAGASRPAADYGFSDSEEPPVTTPVAVALRASRSSDHRPIDSVIPTPSGQVSPATPRVSASTSAPTSEPLPRVRASTSAPTSEPLLGSSPVPPAVEDVAPCALNSTPANLPRLFLIQIGHENNAANRCVMPPSVIFNSAILRLCRRVFLITSRYAVNRRFRTSANWLSKVICMSMTMAWFSSYGNLLKFRPLRPHALAGGRRVF